MSLQVLPSRESLSAELNAYVSAREQYEPSRAYIAIVRILAELKQKRLAAESGASSIVITAIAREAASLGRAPPTSSDVYTALLATLLADSITESTAALAAIERVRALGDLFSVSNEVWADGVRQRDAALERSSDFARMHAAGLQERLRWLNEELAGCDQTAALGLDLPRERELSGHAATRAEGAAATFVQGVTEMSTYCTSVRSQIERMILDAQGALAARRPALEAERGEVVAALSACREATSSTVALHQRRVTAAGLLADLEECAAAVQEQELAEMKLQQKLDLSSFERIDSDGKSVAKLRKKILELRSQLNPLRRRRDGLMREIHFLCEAAPAPSDEEIKYNFPELVVLAERSTRTQRARDAIQGTAVAKRLDVETLLRGAGLLMQRSLKRDYSAEDLPPVIIAATLDKPNVQGRRLRGVEAAADEDFDLKILKCFGVADFKKIKREVLTAKRIAHAGIVPAELAFVDEDSPDKIWIQYPFFSGGNMRQWCVGKDLRAKAVAAARVADAVAALHANSILHRDLKPENIVFPSSDADACPALIDFELALDASQTMATTTFSAGTYLYKSDERTPMAASDVYALGVTLYDFVFGDCVLDALPTQFFRGLQILNLEAVVSKLDSEAASEDASPLIQQMAKLIIRMVDSDPSKRPSSTEVHVRLQDIAAAPTEVTEYVDCVICTEEFPIAEGVRCADRPDAHFMCDDCFGGHVTQEAQAPLEQVWNNSYLLTYFLTNLLTYLVVLTYLPYLLT